MNRSHRLCCWIAAGLALVSTSGCYVVGGRTFFGVVAQDEASNFRSLGQVVSGVSCSQPIDYEDYRRAATKALRQAPGANALGDVTLETQEIGGGSCLRVRGTAGVLQ